jgi:hypothetical protein
MNLTVYVPKALEAKVRAKAKALKLGPSMYVQLVLREALASQNKFTEQFRALLGSWDDKRSADEIVADIKRHRSTTKHAKLR